MRLTGKNICEDTNKKFDADRQIFPSYASILFISNENKKDSNVYSEESKYVYNQLLSSAPDAKDIYNEANDPHNYVPPKLYIGDINSDGYPDVLVTIRYWNGSSIPQILLNEQMQPDEPLTQGLNEAE